jgi:hypothetical protein
MLTLLKISLTAEAQGKEGHSLHENKAEKVLKSCKFLVGILIQTVSETEGQVKNCYKHSLRKIHQNNTISYIKYVLLSFPKHSYNCVHYDFLKYVVTYGSNIFLNTFNFDGVSSGKRIPNDRHIFKF